MKQFEEIKTDFAGVRLYQYTDRPFVIADEGAANLNLEQAEELLLQTGQQVLLLIAKMSDRFLVRCLSKSERIRALELIDFVFGQFGIAKGTAKWAQGSVSEVILNVCMSEIDITEVTDYFMVRADEYFTQCEVIEAITYAQDNPDKIAKMKEYEKARVSWAYVKTTDIVPEGVSLSIRTLENDTGVTVEAGDEVYVMIGCLGEVYQIDKQKFESSYETSDEELDIFAQMFEFIPAVERVDNHTYLPIDEIAKICYPKKGAAILAEKLTGRTRIYAKNGTDYFVGNEGDYMAVRKDDLQDIYIIQGEVFKRTYVEKE